VRGAWSLVLVVRGVDLFAENCHFCVFFWFKVYCLLSFGLLSAGNFSFEVWLLDRLFFSFGRGAISGDFSELQNAVFC
jgi:hypothetical protein